MNNKLLEQLYKTYHKELYLHIYSLCKNKAVAEDILQETFLKAILSLSEQHTNMRAWLYLVARNLYLNHTKKEKGKIPIEEIAETGNAELTVAEQLIKKESKQLLYSALQSLGGAKKEVLIMQYFGSLSQKEIAAVLQITPENVRILAHRGKQEIKKYMEANGYDI